MMGGEDTRHRRLRQMPTANLQLELDHFELLSAEHTHALGEDHWPVQLWREERNARSGEIQRRAKSKRLPGGAIEVLDRRRIDEAKGGLSLVALIEETVPLPKRGKQHVGLCPWHDDTKPSLFVGASRTDSASKRRRFGPGWRGRIKAEILDLDQTAQVMPNGST